MDFIFQNRIEAKTIYASIKWHLNLNKKKGGKK